MKKNWILTDRESGTWLQSFSLAGSEMGAGFSKSGRVSRKTLQSGLSQGVEIIEVDNGALSFIVVPTRGMGIWKGDYRGIDLGWKAPVQGPVHPAFVDLNDRGGLGWLSGFDEWIVRCGLDSHGSPGVDSVLDNQGNPAEVSLTLHGKIANLPAHYVEVSESDDDGISVTGRVDECMLFGPQLRLEATVTTWPDSNRLLLQDRVTNLKSVPAEMELLYHCNFGPPLLGGGSELLTPVREMAPRDARAVEGLDGYAAYSAPLAGYIEQVYWFELRSKPDGDTLAALCNEAGDAAAVLRFNAGRLPCFTQWKNTASIEDGYVTGLEPGTSYPNRKAFEREKGRLLILGPGETRTFELIIEILDSKAQVKDVREEIAQLQAQAEPVIHRAPSPRFSEV